MNPSESEAFADNTMSAGAVYSEPPTGDVITTAGGTFVPPGVTVGVGVGVAVGVDVGPAGVGVAVGVAVGVGGVPDVTRTLSAVEVLMVLVMWLEPARPMRAFAGRDTVPDPTRVQATPSDET